MNDEKTQKYIEECDDFLTRQLGTLKEHEWTALYNRAVIESDWSLSNPLGCVPMINSIGEVKLPDLEYDKTSLKCVVLAHAKLTRIKANIGNGPKHGYTDAYADAVKSVGPMERIVLSKKHDFAATPIDPSIHPSGERRYILVAVGSGELKAVINTINDFGLTGSTYYDYRRWPSEATLDGKPLHIFAPQPSDNEHYEIAKTISSWLQWSEHGTMISGPSYAVNIMDHGYSLEEVNTPSLVVLRAWDVDDQMTWMDDEIDYTGQVERQKVERLARGEAHAKLADSKPEGVASWEKVVLNSEAERIADAINHGDKTVLDAFEQADLGLLANEGHVREAVAITAVLALVDYILPELGVTED